MAMKRILVIDDSDLIRMVVKISLEQSATWEVLTAASAREGLATAATERPDAILLDVEMPDMDGPSTFRALQSSPVTRSIPVILVTATDRPSDRQRLSDLGVVAIVDKPFDPSRLAGQIAGCLGWSERSCLTS